ncbi:hypothetical protein U5640_29935 [Streptomyces sp. SS7]|uniref:hypothetical protein n=1 Tax=Streptomyces sp. SS7 TaxID=3108485 RepID=UPI0030ED2122
MYVPCALDGPAATATSEVAAAAIVETPSAEAGAAVTSAETVPAFTSLTVFSAFGCSGQSLLPGAATAAHAGSCTSWSREPYEPPKPSANSA